MRTELFESTGNGWIEVRDEDGHKAALKPIATLAYEGSVYSLMGAIRINENGENEGGLVLLRQNRLRHDEGTRYEVVGDESEIENVMGRMMGTLLFETGEEDALPDLMGSLMNSCGRSHSYREFCYCDMEEYLQ